MKRADNKSNCPVNFGLEAFGDAWSLLIVRDIVFWGKRTFREFLSSDERIASNILAARLDALEEKGILSRQPDPNDKRRGVYLLTEKGLDLIPILLEISGWSSRYDPNTIAPKDFVERVYANRDQMFTHVRTVVADGGSLFSGPKRIVQQAYPVEK